MNESWCVNWCVVSSERCCVGSLLLNHSSATAVPASEDGGIRFPRVTEVSVDKERPANEAMDVLKTMMFIHIPKTGGTSLEDRFLRKEQTIISRHWPPRGHNWRSPWHMPVHMYENSYHRPYNSVNLTKRFCVVRHPEDRFLSCRAWSPTWNRSFESLIDTYRRKQTRDIHTEETLHRMPQHMFVYAPNGSVNCDCVVSIEKLKREFPVTVNNRTHEGGYNFSDAFYRLYRQDFLLWSAASQSRDFCFYPAPASPSFECDVVSQASEAHRKHKDTSCA